MSNPDISDLPPEISPQQLREQDRVYRTALAPGDYLRLEQLGMKRGLKPFGFTKSVMTLFIHRKLVIISTLPEALQVQINEHLAKTKS